MTTPAYGYIIHYLRAYQPGAVGIVMQHLGSDPGKYFSKIDAQIVRHIFLHNGLGDWVKFQNENTLVVDRLDEIDKTVEAVEFTPDTVKSWCGMIKDAHKSRSVDHVASNARKMAKTDPNAAAQYLANEGQRIAADVDTTVIPDAKQGVSEAKTMLKDIRYGGSATYVRTGIKSFDRMFGGLQRNTFCALGGVFGSGKTALAAQMSFNIARTGGVALWFQLDTMSRGEMYLRESCRLQQFSNQRMLGHMDAVARIEQIDHLLESETDDTIRKALDAERFDLQTAIIPDHEWDNLEKKTDTLEEMGVIIDEEKGLTALQMVPKIRAAKAKHGRIDVVVIDHVGKVNHVDGTPVDPNNAVKQYMEITQYLSGVAPEAAIVCLQHLNTDIFRKQGGENLKPSISDFKGQGAGELHQGFIMLRPVLHQRQMPEIFTADFDQKPPSYQREWLEKCFIYPVKNRGGQSSKHLELRYVGHLYDFQEVTGG